MRCAHCDRPTLSRQYLKMDDHQFCQYVMRTAKHIDDVAKGSVSEVVAEYHELVAHFVDLIEESKVRGLKPEMYLP